MDTSQSRRALFHGSDTASDKLDLFQSLLDSKDLTSDQALALLNIIRPELEKPQRQGRSIYRQYARVMGSLHEQMPEVYEKVLSLWQPKQERQPVEAPPDTAPATAAEQAEPPVEDRE